MSTYVAVFALVLAYAALVAAFCALRILAKLRRATTVLARGARSEAGQQSLLEATGRHAALTGEALEELAELRQASELTRAQLDELARTGPGEVSGAMRNVALVRYDAFAGVSGRMSFSLALLDEHGDGVTLSALAGQTDTRVYAKGVSSGKGENELTPEERQAVAAALNKGRSRLTARKAS